MPLNYGNRACSDPGFILRSVNGIGVQGYRLVYIDEMLKYTDFRAAARRYVGIFQSVHFVNGFMEGDGNF
jgi:hypothetical protein